MPGIPDRIKKIRRSIGLTQEAFARRLGVERSLISKIESGKARLSTSVRWGICNVFAVREEWILKGQGPVWEDRWMLLERRAKELGEDIYETLKACLQKRYPPSGKTPRAAEAVSAYGIPREEQEWWLSLWPRIKARPERRRFLEELFQVWGLPSRPKASGEKRR